MWGERVAHGRALTVGWVCCWAGSSLVLGFGVVGRDVRPAAHLLFFASPKKSRQKKGDPTARVPCAALRGNLRCSVAGRLCGTHCAPAALRSDNRSESEHEAWACCAAPARPTPCAPRHAQRGWETHPGRRCARPQPPSPRPFLAGRRRSRGPSAAMARLERPSGCAEERSGWGERLHRRMQTRPFLTRRSCLNAAPAGRAVSSAAHPTREHRRLPAAKRRDAASGVAFSLVPFFWRHKRKELRRRAHIPASAVSIQISQPSEPTPRLPTTDSADALRVEVAP